MEWTATYLGSQECGSISVEPGGARPLELHDDVAAASKTIRKRAKGHKDENIQMSLSLNPTSLSAKPESAGKPIYQPISKVLYACAHVEGSIMKASYFSYIAAEEDKREGTPGCKYTCHTFKTKNDEDSKTIDYGINRMMKLNAARPHAVFIASSSPEELENAVQWWNAGKAQMFHYRLVKTPEGRYSIEGVIRFKNHENNSTKLISMSSDRCGDALVRYLGEKFNMTDGEVSFATHAVYACCDDGSQRMLDETDNPIALSVMWSDPSEGNFMLMRLPKGVTRVAENVSAPATPVQQRIVDGGADAENALGPLLPYCEEDEDLLLSVMISRQTGAGLGFQLTPSYLLQMCIAYAFLNHPRPFLSRLLTKITSCIGSVLAEHLTDLDLVLFWTCNTMRLIDCCNLVPTLHAAYKDALGSTLENTLGIGLKALFDNAPAEADRRRDVLPAPLAASPWRTEAELLDVVTRHYHALNANMSRANMHEVSERITAAMPSAHLRHKATLLTAATASGSVPPSPAKPTLPSGGDSGSTGGAPQKGPERPGVDPLPDEWEELVDQETKHRFFANHLTRQTSWTDPRDRLITVSLTKNDKGLGFGLSGAKRTWDDRLIIGIFVKGFIMNSAAATDGTLREGDEILEVNNHSLIGVSREGAIEFLREVPPGDTVNLLVSQEPDTWVDPVGWVVHVSVCGRCASCMFIALYSMAVLCGCCVLCGWTPPTI
eukprot:m.1181628 g.1181628  ORF g.1181628 m.1181628 type:complete len:719 (-) comp24535_c0_seq6:3154-5310(-)